MTQINEREDQANGVQNSGNISTVAWDAVPDLGLWRPLGNKVIEKVVDVMSISCKKMHSIMLQFKMSRSLYNHVAAAPTAINNTSYLIKLLSTDQACFYLCVEQSQR